MVLLQLFFRGSREIRSEKAKRIIERLKLQSERLYGPLYFFSSQNEDLFALARKIHGAYEAEYQSKDWSPDTRTQASLKAETDATSQLANSYVRIAKKNSTIMVDILKTNYAYIDPDDDELFRQFVVDQARLDEECPSDAPMKMPLRIYGRVGEIFYMRQEFADRVREKFLKKHQQLQAA